MAIETPPREAPLRQPGPRLSLSHVQQGPRARRTRIPSLHLPSPRQTSAAAPASFAKRNVALLGLELLVGYEWLVSGIDKLLLGTFPGTLGQLLTQSLSGGQLPSFFAAMLRGLVAPNAILFGTLIEWSETLAGLGLMAAGLTELVRPWVEQRFPHAQQAILAPLVRLLDVLAPLAAAGAGVLGLSFFFLDGLPTPWFTPSIAYGGAIDTGLFLATASVIIVASRLARHAAT